jgi:hypothetical protein
LHQGRPSLNPPPAAFVPAGKRFAKLFTLETRIATALGKQLTDGDLAVWKDYLTVRTLRPLVTRVLAARGVAAGSALR